MKKKTIGKWISAVIAVCGLILLSGSTVRAESTMTVIGRDNHSYDCTNGRLNVDYNGMATDADGKKYWFDYGVMAADKEVWDPVSDAWYWFDADGTMAVNKDAFIPTNTERTEGKWVRYNEEGGMIKGEDYRYGGWYWFDPITGEMMKGFVNIPDGTNEGKWVYYDLINGQMHHGESCINGNWYRFDDWTGKMVHGEYCTSEGNWYLYDDITGIMQKGTCFYNGEWRYYDELTGILLYTGAEAEPDEGYFINMAKESLALQNEIRVEAGLEPLVWDDALYQCAAIRGPEIAESFSHTRPDGSSCFSVVTLDYRTLGENIAAGYASAQAVTTGWYNSEGHRNNMLNSSFTSAAVVCYKVKGSTYTWYWVTMFRG